MVYNYSGMGMTTYDL